MNDLDLFGLPVPPPPLKLDGEPRRRTTRPLGYAFRPGSGPEGETCGTCEHACRLRYHNKTYYKCEIVQHRWTHGAGSDILLKSPACTAWAKDKPGLT